MSDALAPTSSARSVSSCIWERKFRIGAVAAAIDRAAAAARRQWRLRLKLGVDRRPCDPLLAAFRKRCVERGGERDGLGALLPEDSLAAVILLLPDLRFEETLCALADDFGPIPENLFARSRTVGDLLSGLVPRTHAEADNQTEAAKDSAPADHPVRRLVALLLGIVLGGGLFAFLLWSILVVFFWRR